MILEILPIILTTLVAVASISSSTTESAFSTNLTDHDALVSIKSSIRDPLGMLNSWNHSINFCHWTGVTCSFRHQRVMGLNLSSQQLEGTLSPHIGNLTFLRYIYLDSNSFHGSIPSQVGHLFRLQDLVLYDNSFQGGFPAKLTHCFNMEIIDLYNNKLEGNLPTDGFGSWSKLDVFELGKNRFTGSIPLSIGNLSSLRFLHLDENNLEGTIPCEVGHLVKLKNVTFSVNNLSGMVPLSLYNVSSLNDVRLAHNQLEGSLPPDFSTLPNLQVFFAGGNNFSCPFPQSLGNASNLQKFDIGGNNIIGPLQINFGRFPYLHLFGVDGNQLGHNQPSSALSFLDSLVNCTRLEYLDLSNNSLRGELPKSIVNFSTTISWLDLSRNYIYGSIPQEIGILVNLIRLCLNNNYLTGSLPQSIGQFSMLGILDLHENNISGEIPASISNITQLVTLSLDSNMLRGSIPTMPSLQTIGLSNNRLSGVIPDQIIRFSSQCFSLNLGNNLFTGTLPSNIGSLKQLIVLDVSGNNFTGEIPTTLGECVMLNELSMQGNHFRGIIPPSLKGLKSLELLDLSINNLSGNIPSFLGEFPIMRNLNLSYNRLEGEVPKEGVFSNLSAFSVIGNLQLCGGIQALHYPACPMSKNKQFPTRVIPLLVIVPLSVLLACSALIFYRPRKSKQKHVLVTVQQDDQHPRLSYQDLLVATAGFSPNNLLGEGKYGAVYKGVVESLQHVVAVKVLNVEVRGASKSFLSECETLRNICHRNLIKIITACSSTDFKGNDFKALVFEFMASGSLENWLHLSPDDEGNERNLTLLQRVNVAIDVALGLDYLHHHSHTKIIHCDIKPSNILLDEEFVARIGDFGLAKFFLTSTGDISGPHSSSWVRGTVGYVPPEYGMGGEISAEGDVYSYGILLLELFSGKRPTENSIFMENANNIHDYVRQALPDKVMKIADPRITLFDHGSTMANQSGSMNTSIQVCLATIFEVGILCSVEMPKERIDINFALKELHSARDLLMSHWQSSNSLSDVGNT